MSDPAWLTALVDQRVALVEHKLGNTVPADTMIMTPLTEPGEDSKIAFEHWDRSCDNCGKYCPPGVAYYTGHLVRTTRHGVRLYITFGVCASCQTTFT